MHLSVPAQLFAWQTDALARTLCSWTCPSKEAITDTDHVAVGGYRLSRRIKTLISNVYHLRFFKQKHKRTHSFTLSLILSVETRKLPYCYKLRFAEVHAFFSKCSIREGPASDESPAEVYTVTSTWVVNLPRGHQSRLPLVSRLKCSASPKGSGPGHILDLLNIG